MLSIFLFSLILGGGLLLVSVLGDSLAGDGELGGEAGADLLADGALDGASSLDAGGTSVEAAANDLSAGSATVPVSFTEAVQLFTVRNLTYFLFGFGGVGTVLTWLSPALPGWVVAVTAVLAGLLTGGLVGVGFGYLRATESGGVSGEESFVGCEGRVVLPVRHGGTGQVMVRRGVREYELRALPFSASAEEPERWRRVVVVDMEDGTARVSPLDESGSLGLDPWATP